MKLSTVYTAFEYENRDFLAKFTLRGYRSAFRAIERAGLVDTDDLTRSAVADWLAERRREGAIPQTVNAQLAALLSVLSWLERSGRFDLDRLLGLRRLRFRRIYRKPVVFLSADEIGRLRRACFTVARRLDLMVCFAIFAGMRMDEIRRLRREHLLLEGVPGAPHPFLRVLGRTKTGKERTTPLPVGFAAWLLEWGLPDKGWLFPRLTTSCKTEYLGRATMHEWLVLARSRAGLPHVQWPTLRHSFASHLRSNGVELGLVSGFMGNTVRICEQHYAALAPGGNPVVEKGFADLWRLVKRPAEVG